MRTYSLLLLVVPSLSFATPKFHCYSAPNMPVQAYEYSSAACIQQSGKNKTSDKTKIGDNNSKSEDGLKEIVCAYQAGCKVVPDDAPAEPSKDLSFSDMQAGLMSGELKASILICKGRGAVDSNGQISDAQCPSPSRCQKNVMYNYGSRSLSPTEPQKAGVTSAVK
ncbi:MAG: hypothetical protein J7501_11445 [Bdellovibrio sp.]|nr:hypothetical protein [Bdellovibrio sp.]